MQNKQSILVTGGAGFIGSNLCEKLISLSYLVICLDNFDTFYSEEIKRRNIKNLLSNQNFLLITGDIRDNSLLNDIFLKYNIDLVIHLAAKAGIRNSFIDPLEYFDVNVSGSICLLEAMKKNKVRNLIFTSSSSVYGKSHSKLIETDSCDSQVSPYAVSKRSIELINYSYYINSGFNVINLRLFSVFGKNQRPDLVIHKFFNQIFSDLPVEIYGDLNISRDFTHISDVLNAVNSSVKLIQESENNIYEIINIGNDNPTTIGQLIRLIEREIPEKDIKIRNRDFNRCEAFQTHADINKAKKLLNYRPQTSLEEGIKLFSNWYRENQNNSIWKS
jgi:UDP-glucuronate 4-epimerase